MVYQRILVIVLTLFLANCSKAIDAEKQPIVFERQSISVSIRKIENSCSGVELSYHVNEFDKSVIIPKGVVGYGGGRFSLDVLGLNGDERLRMITDSQDNNEDVFYWSMDESPYIAQINLADHFDLRKGRYYIWYLYSFEPYQFNGSGHTWIYEIVKSERYYLEINEEGCISSFFD